MGRSVGGFFLLKSLDSGCTAQNCTLHRRVGEIEVGGRAVERAAEQGGQGCPGRGEGL